jgi:hypothetical protein
LMMMVVVMIMVLQLPTTSRFVCHSPAVISTPCPHDNKAHTGSLIAHLSSSSTTTTNPLPRLHRRIGHH